MSTNDKVQFKLTIPRDLYNKLESLADKNGKNSGQEVVMELMAIYLPVWAKVNESMNRAIQYQTNLIVDESIKTAKKTQYDFVEPENLTDAEQNKLAADDIPTVKISTDEDLEEFRREQLKTEKKKKK